MQTLRSIFPPNDFSLLAAILGLLALGAFVNGLFGQRLGKHAVRLLALSVTFAAFVGSAVTFLLLKESDRPFAFTAWHWLDVGISPRFDTTSVDVAFMVDRLSAVMMLVVTGVGFLIHVYAAAYMWHDEREDGGYHRFFAYMNLFCLAMLILVTASNLPLLFVGWEGVGLCSYLLIGFWYSEEANASAGKKAFLANRIGDFGLLVAMALLCNYVGALDFKGIGRGAGALLAPVTLWPLGQTPTSGVFGALFAQVPWLSTRITPTVGTLVALALFLGCVGKSAQIPLYVWLPDAMAGPTPVSALIHAATMVTAGVYLVGRMAGVFLLAPAVMALVAVVGVGTALFAATIAVAQTDIKKVLAYSTVSQLGFMFLGVGVGAFTAGFFHLLTHAFFKACLFLAAGSVIHAMHARLHDTASSQDMRKMGGLRRYLPLTYASFFASCLAIAGFPMTSGFFSKDEILYRAYVNTLSPLPRASGGWQAPPWFGPALYWMGIVAATLTAFYMFRALVLTFFGEFRGWAIGAAAGAHGHGPSEPAKAPCESPRAMTFPVLLLAVFALFGGLLNAGLFLHLTPFEHWLSPVFLGADQVVRIRANAPSELGLALPGVGAFVVGAGGAFYVYALRRGAPALRLAEGLPRLHRLVVEKWRIDELYGRTVLALFEGLAKLSAAFDTWVVDGILSRLSAFVLSAAGTGLRALSNGVVHTYGALMVVGLLGTGYFFVLAPEAQVVVRELAPGHFSIEAAPGLGYSYAFSDGRRSAAFSLRRAMQITVDDNETRTVRLDVKNAFAQTASRTVILSGASVRRAGGSKAEDASQVPRNTQKAQGEEVAK